MYPDITGTWPRQGVDYLKCLERGSRLCVYGPKTSFGGTIISLYGIASIGQPKYSKPFIESGNDGVTRSRVMKLCAAMLVALGVSMAAWAGYDDRFGYFQEQGVMDPAVSSEVTNALVREGIASNDPDTVDRVIRGLGNLASMMAHKRPNAYGEMPSRTFATVPGLK